jgi:hypothetical protein
MISLISKDVAMTDLLIRDVDQTIKNELKRRAKDSGLSLSLVAQNLIRRGMVERPVRTGLGTELRNLLEPDDYVDLDIPRDTMDRPPPDFS